MANTPRMLWPYPDVNVDPWYDAFVGLMNSQDSSGQAAREDRNFILNGGGDVTFTLSTSTLSWASPIQILTPTAGFFNEVAAGSLVVNDGEVIYLDLVRSPTLTTSGTLSVSSVIPSSDQAFIIAVRRGNRIYFRNGNVLAGDETAQVFEGGSILGLGKTLRQQLTMATGATTNLNAQTVVGGGYFDPSKYALNYTSLALNFVAIGSVSGLTIVGSVELYNVTDAAVEATTTFNALAPTKAVSAALTVPSAEKIYEVRAFVDVGAGDSLVMSWAGLQIDQVRAA